MTNVKTETIASHMAAQVNDNPQVAEVTPIDTDATGIVEFTITLRNCQAFRVVVHEVPEADRKSVLVGDTYETPGDAAQYAADEAEALRMLGAEDA